MRRTTFLAGSAALASATAITQRAAGAEGPAVSVVYAGSLVTLMERTIGPAFAQRGYEFRGISRGSVALANQIRDGLLNPDVFISADAKAIDPLMRSTPPAVTWYVTFAATRMVIGYSTSSPFARTFVEVARGTRALGDALLAPGLRLGRTDPTLDPKGYRTLTSAKLLEKALNIPDFARKLLGDDKNPAQILPEETLLTRLEAGELDAAFLYATESTARRIPAVELPKSANLGDSIIYALTIPEAARNKAGAEAFVTYLLSKAGRDQLFAAGLRTVSPTIAGDRGNIPAGLRSLFA